MNRPDEGGEKRVQTSLAFPDEHPASVISDIGVDTRLKVNRIRPPVKAHGGKYYLARQIVPILRTAPGPITEYLEPCAFGASVYLAMPRVEREILGDINPDVVALWQVLSHQRYAAVLSEQLASVPYERKVFEQAADDTSVSLVDRAVRFLIRCRFSRGGLQKTFAWSARKRGGKPGDENAWDTFRETELPKIIDRARGAEVTSAPCWWTVWKSRDKTQRLVYADPLCGAPHKGSSVAHSVMWPSSFLQRDFSVSPFSAPHNFGVTLWEVCFASLFSLEV